MSLSPRSSTIGRWRAGASNRFDAGEFAETIRSKDQEESMAFRTPTYDDIVNSEYAAAMPATSVLPQTETRNYFQAIDNLLKVYAIRPGDKMLVLTHPLLDLRMGAHSTDIATS